MLAITAPMNSVISMRFLAVTCFNYNANSIGKNPKRSQVFCYLRKKRPDILIVVDTRLSKDVENIVKAEWGGYAEFSSFDSQSRGVAIFVQKNLPIKFLDKFSYLRGNILSILVEIEDNKMGGAKRRDSPYV